MKTTKKLAALFLAMVMALSLTAMTAAAYSETGHVHDETCSEATVQPRKPQALCPSCGQGMTEIRVAQNSDGSYYSEFQCMNPECNYRVIIKLDW